MDAIHDYFSHIYQQEIAMRAFHPRRKKFKARLTKRYSKGKK